MVYMRSVFATSLAVTTAFAVPHGKRIAQTITDATTDWVNACTTAGGGAQCQPISQQGFDSLLAAGGNCDQQNAGDAMVTLAKQLNSDPEMIRLAQLFVQQPRNAPDSLQVPYCQTAPNNTELTGLFHCQFASSDFTKFSGDQTGNLPLGVKAVTPPGSCPAKTDGPVPDGVQLNTLVQSPGTPEGGTVTRRAAFTLQNGKDAQALNAKFATLTPSSSCTAGEQACVNGQFAQCVGGTFSSTPCAGGLQCVALPLVNSAGTSVTCDTEADATTRIANTGATGGLTGNAVTRRAAFTLQNGQDAQALNAKFATLTASSPCTAGEQACVNGQFAQCVGGTFSSTPCAGGLQCVALPLVNSAGTSVTCDTVADATTRIANTGATGGLTGNGNTRRDSRRRAAFTLQNGKDAQALNAKFATLSASSSCTAGEEACVNGQFSQCSGGSFVSTPCAGGLQCVALPLVNSAGTSITCDTVADATTRIANTGATGGLTGSGAARRQISGTQTGQGTFFEVGLGACGITNSDSDLIAAISQDVFDAAGGANANPNDNPLCGKSVTATSQGKSVTVTITDRCVACAAGDLDFSPAAFDTLADPSVGRIPITWVLN